MKERVQPSRVGADGQVGPVVGASGSSRRYLPQVLLATMLVGVMPVVAVWWLRASGTLSSYLLGMLLGMVLAMGAAQLGRAFWQTRPGSQDLLFSELMVWGYAHRRYTQARLASARKTLGSMSEAQRGIEGGLSAELQASTLERLAKRLDARDAGTHGHSRRVARYSWMIATRMGLPAEQVARIRTAAAVHDLGKIKTPDAILRKAGSLSDEEYEVMKRHASDGARMAEALNDSELTEMVEHHHERLDGTGYPGGLAGDEIPLGARIISVADTFDSITAHRPYRAAKPHKVALDILQSEAGKQLDPDAVRAFCSHYSGRRALAFWSALNTLPERVFGELGNGLVGAASAAKVVAVAAILGNVAAGTASLAHPSAGHGQGSSAGASVVVADSHTSQSSASGSSSSAGASQRGRLSSRSESADSISGKATLTDGSSAQTQAGVVAGAGASGGGGDSSQDGSSQGQSGSDGSGSSGNGSAGEAVEAHHGRDSETTAETGTGGKPPASATGPSTDKEAAKHKAEPVQGAVEGVKKTVEGTKKTVEGTVESVKGTVKGTVEGTKGKIEEVKGTVEGTVEATKGKVEEVKGKVEEVKGKVEETKGKVEKVLGKVLPKL